MEKKFNLYIGTRDGKKELIGKNYTEQECNKALLEYRKIHYPEHKFYERSNKLSEAITEVDFGSYSDFFYIEDAEKIKEEIEMTMVIADTVNSLKVQDFDSFRQFLKWVERQKEIKEIRYAKSQAYNIIYNNIVIGSFSINNFVWLISLNDRDNLYYISALNGSDTFQIIFNEGINNGIN